MNVSPTAVGHDFFDVAQLMQHAYFGAALAARSVTDMVAEQARRDLAILIEKRRPSPVLGTALPACARTEDKAASGSTAAERAKPEAARDQVAGHDRSAWVETTLAALADERARATEDVALLLDVAEMLVPHFSPLPTAVRPQLVLDDDGQPSFEASRGDFYFDLTIDSPHTLSWYAVVSGQKFHGEDASFTGRFFPKGLRRVFAM